MSFLQTDGQTTAVRQAQAGTPMFVWTPVRYPIRWAERPDEVTPWDPVCGGRLECLPPLGERCVERASHLLAGQSAEAEKYEELLGGGKKPPAERYQGMGEDYPRLTRVLPYQDLPQRVSFFGIRHPDYPDLQPGVGQEIANLRRLNGQKLRDKVLQIAQRYALLAPGDSSQDTLQAWVSAATAIGFYFDLVQQIQGVREFKKDLTDVHPNTWDYYVTEWITDSDRNSFNGIWYYRQKDVLEQQPKAFVERVGKDLWERFRFTIPHATLGQHPGQVLVGCGSYNWAFYELWQLLMGSERVLRCERCGNIFTAKRADAKACSPACQRAITRQKQKEGGSS